MRGTPAGESITEEATTHDLSHRLPRDAPEGPAVAESRIRARSRHLIAAGSVFTALTLATAIIWHIGFGTYMPAAYVTPLYAASCGAILIGCLEYTTRHSREQQACTIQAVLQLQADQLRLVGLLDEELKQQYYIGCADTIKDQMVPRTGTGPAVGRAVPANRSGGDVVELRGQGRRRNDAHL